jgi:E3 ubiquitin-protein ligase EDD1
VGDINVQQLMSYTTFNDESGESLVIVLWECCYSSSSLFPCTTDSGDGSEQLSHFKKWFWSIVERMSTSEKQELVYFWTGSPALPASEEGFQPMPTVTIRPADDQHFPTANTCISRLYIPLYSCKSILRNKLLLAIKIKNFGFV